MCSPLHCLPNWHFCKRLLIQTGGTVRFELSWAVLCCAKSARVDPRTQLAKCDNTQETNLLPHCSPCFPFTCQYWLSCVCRRSFTGLCKRRVRHRQGQKDLSQPHPVKLTLNPMQTEGYKKCDLAIMDVSCDRPKWKCLHQSDLPLINSKRAGTIILYQVQLCGVDRQDVWHTRAARGLLMRQRHTENLNRCSCRLDSSVSSHLVLFYP